MQNKYKRAKDKIYIYDDIDSPVKTFVTEEEDEADYDVSQEESSDCFHEESPQKSSKYDIKNFLNAQQQQQEQPLYTIHEGGSSVSGHSSRRSLHSANSNANNQTSNKFLKTEADYQNYNQQLYLQTSNSQGSAKQLKQYSAKTPKPCTGNRYLVSGRTQSAKSVCGGINTDIIETSERVNRGSSRYRYESKDDDEDEEEGDDNYYQKGNTVDFPLPLTESRLLQYPEELSLREEDVSVSADTECKNSYNPSNFQVLSQKLAKIQSENIDDSSGLYSEKSQLRSKNFDLTASSVMEDSAVFAESTKVNPVYGFCARKVFITRPQLPDKVPKMRGDADEDHMLASSVTSLEFRDPDTNEVFLRTSVQQAKRHIRKISQILQSQNQDKTPNQRYTPRSMVDQGNTDESQVLDNESNCTTTIAGQPTTIIQSILQKMLTMQEEPEQSNVKWTQNEMVALTDIFKTIVTDEIEGNSNHQKSYTMSKSYMTSSQVTETESKVQQLEQQNREMAKEIEALRLQLEQSKPSSAVQTPQARSSFRLSRNQYQHSVLKTSDQLNRGSTTYGKPKPSIFSSSKHSSPQYVASRPASSKAYYQENAKKNSVKYNLENNKIHSYVTTPSNNSQKGSFINDLSTHFKNFSQSPKAVVQQKPLTARVTQGKSFSITLQKTTPYPMRSKAQTYGRT